MRKIFIIAVVLMALAVTNAQAGAIRFVGKQGARAAGFTAKSTVKAAKAIFKVIY